MITPAVTAPVIGLFQAPAPADLAPFVQALVERSDSVRLGVAIELPDTCPLFQFVIGKDYEMRRHGAGSAFAPVPRGALWGPTSAVWEARTDGPVHVYCIVLTHLGAILGRALVGALTEQRIDIRDLDLPNICDDLSAAPDFAARTALVTQWLRAAFTTRAAWHRRDLALADAIAQGRLRRAAWTRSRSMWASARAVCTRKC